MTLQLANGSQMGIRYSLPEDSYMLKMDIWQKDMDRVIPSSAVYWDFIWDQKMRRQEQGRMFEERNSALYYKFAGDDVEHLSESVTMKRKRLRALNGLGLKTSSSLLLLLPMENLTTEFLPLGLWKKIDI